MNNDILNKLYFKQGVFQIEIELRKSKIEDIRRSFFDLKDLDKIRV